MNQNKLDIKEILSSRIKKIRIDRGLTQPELAKLIDSTDRNVSNYETGYSFPSIKVLYKLSIALSVSVDYLFGLTDDPNISNKRNVEKLSADDSHLIKLLKDDNELYQFLAKNPEKGIQYIYKIWKLMNEWKNENI